MQFQANMNNNFYLPKFPQSGQPVVLLQKAVKLVVVVVVVKLVTVDTAN
jgi:hypothetical protein